jgi:hypothetical protein
MDDAARAAVDHLVRDSGALPDGLEVVRRRRSGDRVTTLARWVDARTGRVRRGAVDVVESDGVWRARGGWSADAAHDSDHAVWRAWGSSAHSTSGWVSDPAAATVRLREPRGRLEEHTVENGVAILIYDAALARGSVVELLDEDGNVVRAAPFA